MAQTDALARADPGETQMTTRKQKALDAMRSGAEALREKVTAARAEPTKDGELRMRYAGVLKVLEECSVYVPEDVREMIEHAFTDAAATGRFKWRRVLNRLEIDVI